MSEYINNRELRKNTLKDIIKQLHEGKTIDEVKDQFDKVFKGVSATEISEAEAALVKEGIKIEEIQSLCDVHASVFKGSIEEIHSEENRQLSEIPGHPVNILFKENKEIEKIIKNEIEKNFEDISSEENYKNLKKGLDNLSKIDSHYLKKENLIFPYMEKYDVTAPPKVMWGVDDEIREMIKNVKSMLEKNSKDNELVEKIKQMIEKVREMIFKEENIMIPMLVDKLTIDEWKAIVDEFDEFGLLVKDVPIWIPEKKQTISLVKEIKEDKELITLPTGSFTLDQLELMLNTLPLDITFVDKNDRVKYFSEGRERIFPRTKSVIGREVSNCHPPASVHIVEGIVEDFKNGKKDQEDFWIRMGEQFILIRYFAVRNANKEYEGVLEVTQNIKDIQELKGEKRLVED